jgi:TorA maturation chaperone TorD
MMTEEMTTPSEELSLLSSMYLCKPSREALENWKAALSGESSLFLDELKKTLNEIDTTSETGLEELLWEYTRLFIGPYKLPCPPWESVYTSPKRLMMQDAAVQVQELYEQAGLSINTAEVMPDHIGAELNFLAVLLERTHSEINSKSKQVDMTEKLLNEHLLTWSPDFTRDMENAAETPFYRALARATRKVIDFIGR